MTHDRDALKPLRVRFAPSVPSGGGKFLHIGHAAMMLAAHAISVERGAAFDVRIDGTPTVESTLDVVNCLHWFGLTTRRFYVLPTVTPTQLAAFGSGDASAFSEYELSSSFEDLLVENNTIIVRGNEFAYDDVQRRYDELDRLWGRCRNEINLPLLTRHGRKMSKSDGDNSLHWSVLKDWEPLQVAKYLQWETARGENWEWDWREFLAAMA